MGLLQMFPRQTIRTLGGVVLLMIYENAHVKMGA
jgi:hypothetical protein